jgi:hypothetical protein
VCRADGVNLASPDEPFRALLQENGLTGIYLWTIRPGTAQDDEHVVYVGRTNSLARRIAEYLRGFQPHSVNDFKLQIFQERLLESSRGSQLCLYFKPEPVENLPKAEKCAVDAFRPLLNERMKMSAEAQEDFRRAFKRYYAAGFTTFLPCAGDA